MTTITRNLPWFIRDLGVSIIGQKCYTSLIADLNLFSDFECIKYSLSKVLGIGLVIGGSIMKLPQIALILRARSVRGLSLSAFTLETFAYTINTFYNLRNSYPFTTYGENASLTMQNTLITFLIIFYTPLSRSRPVNIRHRQLFIATLVAFTTLFLLATLPMRTLSFLQLATLPISVLSKIPQIQKNARSKSTGQLSAFAVGAQVAGCAARVYTTAVEVGDLLVGAGFVVAFVMNAILAVQVWVYWGRWGDPADGEEEEEYVLVAAGNGAKVKGKGRKRLTAPWVVKAGGGARKLERV